MERRSLRVLQLVHGYPPAVGGVEFAVRDLCEGLAARHGAEVTVLTTDAFTNANFRDGGLPTIPIRDDEVVNGVRVRRFPVVTRWALPLRVAQGLAWRARLPGNDVLRTLYQGPISPGLRHAASALPADVICAASLPLNHLRYAFRRSDGRPVILVAAAHPWDPWGYDRPNLLRLTRRAWSTIAFTGAERNWLVERGAPPERVRVVPLGIRGHEQAPFGRFRSKHGIPAGAFVVTYAGQQGSHKGIDDLIRVLPLLLEQVPDAWLVVAGAVTPYSADLDRLAGRLPASSAARFLKLDGVTEEEKVLLLRDCDVFASPSAQESFGLTTLEAWAQGRPVLVGDGPAQRELLEDGSLGLLVRHGDAEQLLGELVRLAANPDLRARLGQGGRQRLLERYTIERVVDAYQDLYQAAAAENARLGRP